ncbi:hypothetical protein L1987_27734 [Smallanthus sonchifolius]|uniref:Uncharacterized protein n=4 Tax=Smallanthus sonchifolius TaxID=185202 RepID=A0ACB9IAV3_9ASTR|nr:hypothetical protein L1987_27729 [Smallanthus sonchifolius]KAI3805389.1 hypothetical protein L1987_27732 [Smallanthus sonchifolius]KAI3805390.1 hypothetical protein L1987_27733 [Smallanthus sonchifolius]KAI3805391.1 hypothetical protein L1987_27734 [Smallanthus sonchifolius]
MSSFDAKLASLRIPLKDINSLGIILLEVLYGRKATIEDVNHYLTKIEENNYGKGEHLDDMIAPNLTQMHTESLSIFSRIAYTCLKYGPEGQRDHILGGLNEAAKIQWKHENPVSTFIMHTESLSVF